MATNNGPKSDAHGEHQHAYLGGGCFWCIEAVFERIPGVVAAESGYAGGHAANPTYEQVCTGRTGHAEVVEVTFDPSVISYEDILKRFFTAHDPTTLNRQGADTGTQYRSIVLYESDEQRAAAEAAKAAIQKEWSDPVVTEIVPLERFWRAEEYHQDYFAKNPFAGYCQAVIKPKISKLHLGPRIVG